jgi:hypothetical protein
MYLIQRKKIKRISLFITNYVFDINWRSFRPVIHFGKIKVQNLQTRKKVNRKFRPFRNDDLQPFPNKYYIYF